MMEKGFIHISLSDFIREELKKEKKDLTRDNLISKGNELRKKHGNGILADFALRKIKKEKGNYIITSIRNPEEIKILEKSKERFVMVKIDAPLKIRFERMKKRMRENDPITLKEFAEKEKKEMKSKDKSSQQLIQCMKKAKITIMNNGSLMELYEKIDKMVFDLKIKFSDYKRPSWDEYFINLAIEIGKRGTCNRGRSGCVIVKDKQILSTGYVGSPKGTHHCDEIGHQFKKTIHEDGTISNHCVRTTHAEQNAICQAAKNGVSINGATLYCNMEPCYACAKMIINSGIKRVVAKNRYHAAADLSLIHI